MSFFKKINFSLHNCFEFLFSVFVFLLPWQTVLIIKENSFGNIGIFGFEIFFWILALMFLAWFLNGKIEPHKLGKWGFAATLFSFAFLIYTFSSVLWSLNTDVAFFQAIRITEAFFLVFMLAVFPFRLPRLLWAFVGGVLAQALLGIFQFLTQSTFALKWLGIVSHPLYETGTSVVQSDDAGRWLRAYGALPHPNVFGGLMVIGIIFTTILFRKSALKNRKEKFLFSGIFLCQIAGLFFSFSRSAWIATLLWIGGIIVYSVYHEKKPRLKYLISFFIFFLALCVVYFPVVKTRFMGESYHEVRSIEERESGPKFAFELFRDQPWTGVGIGNYVPAIMEKFPNAEASVYQPVHVAPLLFLTEFGVVGFLLFTGLVISLFFFHKKMWMKSDALLFALPLVTLLLLDHYLYSLAFGILLLGLYVGFTWRQFLSNNF